ncbi:secretion protein HlyD family protein [Ancylobacter novellus DSM 506]|uniref:Secretion protein HlyD family protein n=1 Tax=Ancylobacter novellus (strain ATCC 8093 / DSM 506 / JCM 20403 / CCM 1077 / IAM 12100 / NBRC 12443 / NCIMB 10456) TaxID=639283 RepID=D7A857_ANCN5|nr:HlyD family secretion protein [Ancylobacter novellus]ADH90515.1 secretion protein HlyD family protein [Ancylobacter novellus DSM 506]
MTFSLRGAVRVGITLLVLLAAVSAGHELWAHYMDEPWTRDAKVRADIVGVAPDVSGFVSEVLVRDNQAVKQGDVLFRIDRARFAIALEQAEAAVEGRKATLEQARRDRERYEQLKDVVSQQKTEQARMQEAEAAMAHRQALADRDLARLNLERSEVKASVNGTITNLSLRPGDYITAGTPEMALVDTDSLRIEGYFEETKLARISVGAPVTIRLMGQPAALEGHVESIAAGIEDRERTVGNGLLANINPTFNWVRLAQRVPVRIALDNVPDDARLVAGLTATVVVR